MQAEGEQSTSGWDALAAGQTGNGEEEGTSEPIRIQLSTMSRKSAVIGKHSAAPRLPSGLRHMWHAWQSCAVLFNYALPCKTLM